MQDLTELMIKKLKEFAFKSQKVSKAFEVQQKKETSSASYKDSEIRWENMPA